ncbi:hypothetical protein C0J52_17629 [Blattella germanica]|nr:hypothetical protein C0J52_17629 [Blattella germanica]
MIRVSIGATHKALKLAKLHPYRVKVFQELQPPDLEKRRRYCEWFRAFTRNNRTSVTVGFNEISHSIAEITPETLRKVSRNMRRRVELCLQENGGHFQHLL